jgi:hypothetical protein
MFGRSAQPQGSQRLPGSGYEQRDVSAKWIFGIVAFLVAAGLVMHFCLAGMMQRLGRTPTPQDAFAGAQRSSASVAELNTNVPHLQLSPPRDLEQFRAREEAELNSYGWIDRTAGVVRVPIERAMELVLQRGLPTRSGSNGDQTGPSSFELQQQRVPAPQGTK